MHFSIITSCVLILLASIANIAADINITSIPSSLDPPPTTTHTHTPTTTPHTTPTTPTPTTTPHTTHTTTSHTPIPTLPPIPANNNTYYRVNSTDNSTCILFQLNSPITLELVSTVKYPGVEVFERLTMQLPGKNDLLNYNGTCPHYSNHASMSNIYFNTSISGVGNVNLTFYFTENLQAGSKDYDKWQLSNVTLSYTDSSNNNTLFILNNTDAANKIMANAGRSYTCTNVLSLKLVNTTNATYSNITLSMNDYTIQPFNVSKSKLGNELNCNSEGMPSYIPVIVGGVLAGLVVLVLIAYIIGRFRSSKRERSYERLN